MRQPRHCLKKENILSKEYEYIFVIYFLLPLAVFFVIFQKHDARLLQLFTFGQKAFFQIVKKNRRKVHKNV